MKCLRKDARAHGDEREDFHKAVGLYKTIVTMNSLWPLRSITLVYTIYYYYTHLNVPV